MQDMMARRAPKMHGELSHQERALVQQQVELYLDGQLEQLQIVSVKQIEVSSAIRGEDVISLLNIWRFMACGKAKRIDPYQF